MGWKVLMFLIKKKEFQLGLTFFGIDRVKGSFFLVFWEVVTVDDVELGRRRIKNGSVGFWFQ